MLLEGVACNTVGRLEDASATEKAMLIMAQKFGSDFDSLRNTHLPDPFVRFQFTSKRKKMGTIMQNVSNTEHDYPYRLVLKGASEIVL